MDRNTSSRNKGINARARRVDVGSDLVGTSQPSVFDLVPAVLLNEFGGTLCDPLDQLVANVEPHAAHQMTLLRALAFISAPMSKMSGQSVGFLRPAEVISSPPDCSCPGCLMPSRSSRGRDLIHGFRSRPCCPPLAAVASLPWLMPRTPARAAGCVTNRSRRPAGGFHRSGRLRASAFVSCPVGAVAACA
jgi:hypothetical protein